MRTRMVTAAALYRRRQPSDESQGRARARKCPVAEVRGIDGGSVVFVFDHHGGGGDGEGGQTETATSRGSGALELSPVSCCPEQKVGISYNQEQGSDDEVRRFDRDFAALSNAQKEAFRSAVQTFVADLARGEGFGKGLRVKGIRGAPGMFELTWAVDGRATFSDGESRRAGEPHIVWHRVGTHDIL